VVRLDVDAALVERRLSSDPTEGRRQDDLHVALEWLVVGRGVGRLLVACCSSLVSVCCGIIGHAEPCADVAAG
jgi:hypothetical protein